MKRAGVQVFVDDFVIGRLPGVCAVTGQATTDQVKLRFNTNSLSPVWLVLIFFGPIGWIVMLAMSSSRRNYLAGWLPYLHEEAQRRRNRMRATAVGGAVVAVVALVLSWALDVGLLLGVGLAVVVGTLVVLVVYDQQEPEFELDASGRWLTISNVHPNFIDAVEDQSADHDRSLPRL